MDGIDAVIFDKDGVLLDFNRTWGRWLAGFLPALVDGDPARSAVLAQAVRFDPVSLRFAPDSPAIAGTPEASVDCLLPHLPEWTRDALIAHSNQAVAEVEVVPVAPLRPVLTELAAAGLAIGVVTNDAHAAAQAHLAQLGIDALVAHLIGYDSGHGEKPDPGPLLAMTERLGVAPGRAIMVGDSLHDLEAARAAGCFPLAVLSGPADEETLKPLAAAILPSVVALPGWLAGRAGGSSETT